jgi:hypothetical protein
MGPELARCVHYFLNTPHAGKRGLDLGGACLSTEASERSKLTQGTMVDEPMKNARFCRNRVQFFFGILKHIVAASNHLRNGVFEK